MKDEAKGRAAGRIEDSSRRRKRNKKRIPKRGN